MTHLVERHYRVLVVLLTGAMVSALFLHNALSVLAVFLVEDLGITKAQLGAVFAAFSFTGALACPYAGRLADWNTRYVMVGLFGFSTAGLMVAASAPNLGVLLGAAALGGLSLAAGVPVTNRIVSEEIPVHRQGQAMGIKSSGPQLGLLVVGLLLPPLALAIGWRGALGSVALLPLAGLVAARLLIRPDHSEPAPAQAGEGEFGARSTVRWLTALGLGVALANSVVLAFLPLFAYEQVGLSPATAGRVAALMGLTGVVGRVAWGSRTARFRRPSTALRAISSLSVLATVLIVAAPRFGAGLLWLGAAAAGGSMFSWHVVAWLVLIDRVDPRRVGKASGIMNSGSLIGFGSGPFIAGALIDATSSYVLTWWLVAGLFGVLALATWLMSWWEPREIRSR